MKPERLKRFNIMNVVCVLLVIIIIILVISLKSSKASYRFTASYPAAYGTINWKMGDISVLAINIEQDDGTYSESDDFPTSGYVLNEENSYCTVSVDGEQVKQDVSMSYTNNTFTVTGLTKKGTKCFLYLDIYIPNGTFNEILAANYYTVDTSRKSGEFTSIFVVEDTAGRIFEGPADDYGDTTYFFASANPNNWVKFGTFGSDVYYGYYSSSSTSYKTYNSLSECESASSYNVNCSIGIAKGSDMYWRIIRVNGNGSIRLIYNGTATDQTGEETTIGTSAFNSSYDDNAYVGYMYGTAGASTYAATHTNTNSSTIKGVLDTWYQSNIASYSDKIDTDVGFCGDRSLNTSDETWNSNDTKLGYGTNTTYYGSYGRIYLSGSQRTTMYPTLTCPQANDLYTVSSSSYGNKALTYPIGLITADEVLFGGLGLGDYVGLYLYSGSYWTMSPSWTMQGMNVITDSAEGIARAFYMGSDGSLRENIVVNSYGVRPVLNLASSTVLTGLGTSSSPFIVSS